MDAASFTAVRLIAGVIVLFLLVQASGQSKNTNGNGSWLASFMLFLYTVTFSFAYLTLDTGTGALILFGSLQVTIVVVTLRSGTQLHVIEWLGLLLAVFGFVYLMLPGANAPPLGGFLLMTCAGAATALYTLSGHASINPLRDTYFNFLRTVPMVLFLSIPIFWGGKYSLEGIMYAVISGGLTSGVGYAVWYSALRGLSSLQAGVVQLLVPVIAALGGVIFVGETLASRLPISALLILGGIVVVVLGRYYFDERKPAS